MISIEDGKQAGYKEPLPVMKMTHQLSKSDVTQIVRMALDQYGPSILQLATGNTYEQPNYAEFPSRQGGKSRMQEEFTRARFEEWYKKTYWDFKDIDAPYQDGRYSHLDVQLAWAAYQQGIHILKGRTEKDAAVQAEKDAAVQAECHSLKKKLADTELALWYARGSLDSVRTEAAGWKTRARRLEKQLDEEKKKDVYTLAAENIVLAANLAKAERDLHLAMGGLAHWQTRAAFLQSAVATARDTLENV